MRDLPGDYGHHRQALRLRGKEMKQTNYRLTITPIALWLALMGIIYIPWMVDPTWAAKTPVTQSPLELRVEELERKISELEKRLPPLPTWSGMNLTTPCAQYGIDAGAAK